jgi:Flp pilus assembly protein TadG
MQLSQDSSLGLLIVVLGDIFSAAVAVKARIYGIADSGREVMSAKTQHEFRDSCQRQPPGPIFQCQLAAGDFPESSGKSVAYCPIGSRTGIIRLILQGSCQEDLKMKFKIQPTMRRPPGRNWDHHRQGAATVEFAVVVPVLTILILGLIEYAQVINVSQTVSSASRRGARLAARSTTGKVSEVKDFVTKYVVSSIPRTSADQIAAAVKVTVANGSGVPLTGSDLNSASSGSSLAVEVALKYDTVRWFRHFGALDNKTLKAITTVRRE